MTILQIAAIGARGTSKISPIESPQAAHRRHGDAASEVAAECLVHETSELVSAVAPCGRNQPANSRYQCLAVEHDCECDRQDDSETQPVAHEGVQRIGDSLIVDSRRCFSDESLDLPGSVVLLILALAFADAFKAEENTDDAEPSSSGIATAAS